MGALQKQAKQVRKQIAQALASNTPQMCVITNDSGLFSNPASSVQQHFNCNAATAAELIACVNNSTLCTVAGLVSWGLCDEQGTYAHYSVALPSGVRVVLHCNDLCYVTNGALYCAPFA